MKVLYMHRFYLLVIALLGIMPFKITTMEKPLLAKRGYEARNWLYNDIVDMINNNQDLNERKYCNNDRTTLCHVAFNNRLEEAELLLTHNADPNAPSASKASPLVYAVEGDHPEMVDLLLGFNAKPNLDGCFPLHAMCWRVKDTLDDAKSNIRLKIVQSLMKAGADPERKDRGKTALEHLMETSDFCGNSAMALCNLLTLHDPSVDDPIALKNWKIILEQRTKLMRILFYYHTFKNPFPHDKNGKTVVDLANKATGRPFLDMQRRELARAALGLAALQKKGAI